MSVWIDELWAAVRNRLLADAGTGGLFNSGTPLINGGIFNQFATPAIDTTNAYPYIVYELSSMQQADSFDGAVFDVQFELQVIMSADGADPMLTWAKVFDRVYGDWHAQSNREPTFGLHRWNAGALTSGWTVADLAVVSADNRTEQDGGLYIWAIQLACTISKG